MKLVRFAVDGRAHFGALTADGIADLSGGPWKTLFDLLTNETSANIERLAQNAHHTRPVERISFLPPIAQYAKIICVGMAYRAHAAELGAKPTDYPSLFIRFPSSFVGHGVPVVRPFYSKKFDYEAELGVVIGKRGRHISSDRAMSHIAGYTCVAENSVRDYQQHNAQVTPGKNFDASGAVGPSLLTADEVSDPAALTLKGRLNGVEMQRTLVSDLLYTIPEIIAYISQFTELSPGDLIATGTPSGVGALKKPPVFMKEGDRFDVEVTGVGILSNPIIDEQQSEYTP